MQGKTSRAPFAWLRKRAWVLAWLMRFREGFAFLPLVLGVAGGGLATLLFALDPWVPTSLLVAPPVEAARTVSSTLVGAVLGVAATTFTIVMAVLTLASSQFGPRLLRQFLKDGVSQATLGIFLAVASYHLAVLALLDPSDRPGVLPVWGGLVVAAAGGVALVVFVQHFARSVHADVIVARVGTDFEALVADLCGTDTCESPVPPELPVRLPAGTAGYLQSVDLVALQRLAGAHDLEVRVVPRPGAHLLPSEPLLQVDRPVDEALASELRECASIGDDRSPTQDLEFVLAQLAEMAVRAMSPGINDPFTAELCIHRMTQGLATFVDRGAPPSVFGDDDGKVRVWMRWPTFDELLGAATHRLRPAAGRDAGTLLTMLRALARLSNTTPEPSVHASCARYAREVRASAGPDIPTGDLARLDAALADVTRLRT
ncbi:MAG: DUF2254 domain-containing protein [Myxococcota bacterium]